MNGDQQIPGQMPPPFNPQYGDPQQPGGFQQPGAYPPSGAFQQPGAFPQPGMMQPMTAQPAATTAVVVQPGGGGNQGPSQQGVRGWSTGLFGCFSDCGSCIYAACCFPCFMCSLSSDLGEDCFGPFFCGPSFLAAMRTKTRVMYGIRGSICSDLLVTCCCTQCAMCQLSRELKNSSVPAGNQVAPAVTVVERE